MIQNELNFFNGTVKEENFSQTDQQRIYCFSSNCLSDRYLSEGFFKRKSQIILIYKGKTEMLKNF